MLKNAKKEDTSNEDICLETIVKDLNTLLNGTKSRRETKLYASVRNLVKYNLQEKRKDCDECECSTTKAEHLENHAEDVSSIFLSHHSEDQETDDFVTISRKGS